MTLVIAVPAGYEAEITQGAADVGVPVQAVPIGKDGSGIQETPRLDVVLSTGALDEAAFLQLLRAHPEIRWVHGTAAGVDALLIPEIMETEATAKSARPSPSAPNHLA